MARRDQIYWNVQLCKESPNFADYLIKSSYLENDQKDEYLTQIFQNADLDDCLNQNEDYVISDYIDNHSDIYFLFEPILIGDIKILFKHLNIKTRNIGFKSERKIQQQLFDFIYEQNHYEINIENLHSIYEIKGSPAQQSKLAVANYSTIFNSELENLKSYVDENLNQYITEVMLDLDNNTQEEERYIVKLFNTEGINTATKLKILHQRAESVSKLYDFDPSYWEVILGSGKLKISWLNVFEFYTRDDKFTSPLIEYLNNSKIHTKLAEKHINFGGNKAAEVYQKFSKEFLLSSEISDETVSKVTSHYLYYYETNPVLTGVSNSRMEILINNGIIRLSEAWLKDIRDNYSQLENKFLANNIDAYLAKPKDYVLTAENMLSLLYSNQLKFGQKLHVSRLVDSSMVEEEPRLAKELANFQSSQDYREMDYGLLTTILTYAKGETSNKLFQIQLSSLSDEQVLECIYLLEPAYQALLEKGKYPKLDATELNWKIVHAFEHRKIIKRSKPEKDFIRVINNK